MANLCQICLRFSYNIYNHLHVVVSQCTLISTNLSKHVSVAFGQTEIWALLVFGLFHLSLPRKVHQSPWKVLTIRESLWGTIYHALGMVFRLFRGVFCAFFAMRTCFQRQFSSISCIFNSSKHVTVAKKWQKRRERVLTNCNHAKSDGNVVSNTGFCFLTKNPFLDKFQIFLVLVRLLRILTHNTWQLH